MNTSPEIRYFDYAKYRNVIELIHKEQNNTIKEQYYKKIAIDIINSEGITDKIKEGPGTEEIQGVPFDLIGPKGNDLIIIELKGSDQRLNFPKEVQLVRMEKLINQAKKENIELKPLLLQINLKYCFYFIWPTDFLSNCFMYTDKKLGSRPIVPIVEWIKKFLIDV